MPSVKLSSEPEAVVVPQKWEPRPYMRQAMKFLLSQAHGGLLLDPGMSKTAISLGTFKLLKKANNCRGMLVVAPVRPCHMVWPAERDKWLDFNHLTMEVLHSDKENAPKLREEALARDADIYVINFEGLEWLFGPPPPRPAVLKGLTAEQAAEAKARYAKAKEKWDELMREARPRTKRILERCDILCIDELSKLKHLETSRGRAIKPWLKKFLRRWGLTGSFASNGMMDLFGQCYILDEGGALGPYITHYRNKYFNPTGYGGYTWVLKEGVNVGTEAKPEYVEAEEAINRRIAPLVFRLSGEDYLTLPEKHDNIINVDIKSSPCWKHYKEFEEELFLEVDRGIVTAANAGARLTKLAQMASGGVYLDPIDEETGLPKAGKREWQAMHTLKDQALVDLIEELNGQQLFIAYHYGHDLDRLKKTLKLKEDAPILGRSLKADKAIETQWNRGDLQLMLGHPQSVGHGLNFQGSSARHIFWYTLTYDYEMYDQLNRRLIRQGSDAKRVTVHHCLAKGTVDELKLIALRRKHRGQANLYAALQEYRRGKATTSRRTVGKLA